MSPEMGHDNVDDSVSEPPRNMSAHTLVVGSITHPELYTLSFKPPTTASKGSLDVIKCFPTCAAHSWIHISRHADRTNLYATAWIEPPCVVAYQIYSPTDIRELNRAPTASRSGYVTASALALYSAGGANGDVLALDSTTGGFSTGKPDGQAVPIQTQSFVDSTAQRDNGSTMDFGGLRHGAHSADLSRDGRAYYVADIGRNCIWTYSVSPADGRLTLGEKHTSPRKDDGPRHAWPHPGERVLYVVQEHTSMVDVFRVDESGTRLRHAQGVRIIPEDERASDYWADEVRTSLSDVDAPKYLYASTRGLTKGKKGYVCVYKLREDGLIDGAPEVEPDGPLKDGYGGLLCMWETPTSGGWANAVQPGPTIDGIEYVALTDSEVGWVFVLAWDGQSIQEVARARLNEGSGAATALWL